MKIHAAVVRKYGEAPRYEPFELPEPAGDEQELVDVLAVGLHPRVRTGAAGDHYSGAPALPLVPGIDGVGRRADGKLVYFVADDELTGPMATRTVIDRRRSVTLPDGANVLKIAAALNPAMSSWVALRRRVPLQEGQSVLILGASGNAGRMAVQVAKRLGAGRVVAAGRNTDRLTGTGADVTVALADGPDVLAKAASEVDVVLDYLWGKPAADAMLPLLTARSDRSRALDWIQIGAVAGPTIELPSVALRSANFRLLGNGQGAVSTRGYLAELPSLIDEIDGGGLQVSARPVPLTDIEAAWAAPDRPGVRSVLVPVDPVG